MTFLIIINSSGANVHVISTVTGLSKAKQTNQSTTILLSLLYLFVCNWFTVGWFFNSSFWGWFAIITSFELLWVVGFWLVLLFIFFKQRFWFAFFYYSLPSIHQIHSIIRQLFPFLFWHTDISESQNQILGRAKSLVPDFFQSRLSSHWSTTTNSQNFTTLQWTGSQTHLEMCFLDSYRMVKMSN